MFVIHVVKNKINTIITSMILLFIFLLLVAVLDLLDFIPFSIIKKGFLLVYVIVTGLYIFRYMLATFTYSLINKDFIVRRSLGKKVETIFDIPIQNIQLIAKSSNPKVLGTHGAFIPKNMTANLLDFNTYTMVFKQNGQIKKIKIEADKHLLTVFKKVLGEIVYDV